MLGGIGFQELIVVFLVVLLLFGAKRIPSIAQNLGRGIKDFKRALTDSGEEISKIDKDLKSAQDDNSDKENKE